MNKCSRGYEGIEDGKYVNYCSWCDPYIGKDSVNHKCNNCGCSWWHIGWENGGINTKTRQCDDCDGTSHIQGPKFWAGWYKQNTVRKRGWPGRWWPNQIEYSTKLTITPHNRIRIVSEGLSEYPRGWVCCLNGLCVGHFRRYPLERRLSHGFWMGYVALLKNNQIFC